MFSLKDLSPEAQGLLVNSYHIRKQSLYQEKIQLQKSFGDSLSGFKPLTASQVKTDAVIFATDSYEAHSFNEKITFKELSQGLFVPRIQKTKEDQKNRTKQKAEVFTPSFVCNLQNNLIDEAVLKYSNAFNTEDPQDRKKWIPTSDKIRFTDEYTWIHYVTEKRLEMTCGEAPYLFSGYDTVSGDLIPVRDSRGRFQRIGLLDRKLRVAYENTTTLEDYKNAAWYAAKSIYGYEWQGDNLILARLNFINTVFEYMEDLWQVRPTEEEILAYCELASWQIWQMDGLKMVVPMTCSSSCLACEKKTRGGHDGTLALLRMGNTYKTFEELGPVDWFPLKVSKKQENSLF